MPTEPAAKMAKGNDAEADGTERRVSVQLKNESGEELGGALELPLTVTAKQLETLTNSLLSLDEPLPVAFFSQGNAIRGTLAEALESSGLKSGEGVVEVEYRPEAVYRVLAVTRCTSSLPGHAEAVISAQFSPDGRCLASGSGDTTVRLWDLTTELPLKTCEGHENWVLAVAWSPDARFLASADKNGVLRLWDGTTGSAIGGALKGHKQWVSCLVWQPFHLNPDCRLFASSSKDGDIRIWDRALGKTVRVLSGHSRAVTWLRWGGSDLIYSASQDRTVKVWRASDGVMCRTLEGHGHWVNTMALNTDYALRVGPFDPRLLQSGQEIIRSQPLEEQTAAAKKRWEAAKGSGEELLASGSDDFSLFLWGPGAGKKPLARMTGHQQLVNQVAFSPDGRWLCSASFDKSVKLWCGRSGKFVTTFRGHVQAVYQVAFSADSRLMVSGSADSTLKVWSLAKQGLAMDLPGHADEVYTVDWSPDGARVVSGGKDKILKLWRR